MTKMHHECPKYPKILKNNQNAPRTTSTTPKTFQMTNTPLNPENKQNSPETSENDQNTPKLSQNTLNFLDLGCILVGFKFFCSFQRILGHFANLSYVMVYILIIFKNYIKDFQGIIEVFFVGFKLFCSLQRILGHFAHISNVEGYSFIHFRCFGHFCHLQGIKI